MGRFKGLVQETAEGADDGATFMMHVGANSAPSGKNKVDSDKYVAVAFTNVLADARKDATKFFDVASKDEGVCTTRDDGAITTYTTRCQEFTANRLTDRKKLKFDQGSCLIGDGHHFCSFDREGARLSNAGGILENKLDNGTITVKDCGGTARDTVYWAWEDDNFGCGGLNVEDESQILPVIGTGCNRYVYIYIYIYYMCVYLMLSR